MSAKSNSKPGAKKPSNSGSKGKLLYHSREESKERVGDSPATVVEKTVTHSEDGLFCKFYEKKNGVALKITIKSKSTGGEYSVSIKKGDADTKSATHNKKDLLAFLKENKNLDFITKYVEKEKMLARPKSKSTKSKSKSKSKLSRPKSAKSKSKSKSKPKSKSAKPKAKTVKPKAVKSKSKSKSKSKPKAKKASAPKW